jgi:hypothetical protein
VVLAGVLAYREERLADGASPRNVKTKRLALGKLSYGRGALVPKHVLAYPDKAERAAAVAVQNGHQAIPGAATRTEGKR